MRTVSAAAIAARGIRSYGRIAQTRRKIGGGGGWGMVVVREYASSSSGRKTEGGEESGRTPSAYETRLSPSLMQRFLFKKATHSIAELYRDATIAASVASSSSSEPPKVVLHGWIDGAPRKMSKKLTFARLRGVQFDVDADEQNTIQLVQFRSGKEEVERDGEVLARMKQETPVCVEGTVSQHQGTNRYEVKIISITALNHPHDLASQVREAKEWDPKDRYLQLRTPQLQRALAIRSKAAKIVRDQFISLDGFTEVETPLLFRSTPEGAREFLVPSRANERKFYALPQSPQQYKQLLMAGGVHRYFQIAKCFRDEDLRADRQPEFTQVDLEMGFAGAEDVIDVVERCVARLWGEVRGAELQVPFPRMTYLEAMTRYGIDKPDVRGGMEIIDLSEFATATVHKDYPVFEILIYRPLPTSSPLPDPSPPPIYPTLRTPYVFQLDSPASVTTWLMQCQQKFNLELTSGDLTTTARAIAEKYDLRAGDVVYACTRQSMPFENPTPLGRERLQILRETGVLDNESFAPLWVVEFPLFTPLEKAEVVDGHIEFDYDSLTATHHPFTMPALDSLPQVMSAIESGEQVDPRTVLGQHYDLVLNGVEVGGGSTRIHDSLLQRLIMAHILRIPHVEPDPHAAQPRNPFTHLLTALSMGCPPHAGLALGFDRVCAMLAGSESIRDVIAFPKTHTGADPLVGSPSEVTDAALDVYHLRRKR
ncbi:hypothetical protein BZA70DRAFT_289100 [Myxozyma melibiosi]|uniref:Aminoacyl-transfer RNA synthetases class-II family profile domain-containing protein n=1 Tax=Myxozyma melibiosi TaxID=54550 RepID=A0ABR1F7W6_9ASCO